ncbi:MAG: alcohol dehydrogenase catalytic domain-containing protein [Armatimonadota bacterium]
MNDKVKQYKKANGELPSENLAWRLYGAGVENFGDNGKPAVLPMPKYGPDELLSRVDAIGICFSDIKLINQGSNHPRITGRDLVNDPATPGHEVSLTIVGVGDNLKSRFAVGEKYVVQADVFYKGASIAYGYVLPGGMQQYGVIGKEIINGDEGCYLLPVKPDTGYAAAALSEPWACVVASYRIEPRRAMKQGGVALFVGPPSHVHYYPSIESRPSKVILADTGDSINPADFEGAEVIVINTIEGPELTALSEERTGGRGFDDIFVLGQTDPKLIEQLSKHLASGGFLDIISTTHMAGPVAVDVGRVHYDGTMLVGGRDIDEGYKNTSDSELTPGGCVWFIGAAGPMGQMHVERAVSMKNGPGKILATDVDSSRLSALRDRVAGIAEKNGIDIRFVNPAEVGDAELEAIRDGLTGGAGFSDIVVLAPVPALIEQAAPYLGNGGKMNIFAGVPRGTIANFDVSPVYLWGVRYYGSSGSKLSDLKYTLSEAEKGNLPTNRSVAAIGGINAVGDGIKAVKEARFPGKTVIFPQIKDLPLTALADLGSVLPSVYEKLEDGQFWTKEAEEELFGLML